VHIRKAISPNRFSQKPPAADRLVRGREQRVLFLTTMSCRRQSCRYKKSVRPRCPCWGLRATYCALDSDCWCVPHLGNAVAASVSLA